MLQLQGIYNDLSNELRKEIEEKIESFGNTLRIKFDIAKQNPDPQKYNGAVIYPFLYTLDPKTFKITDPYEKRDGKSKIKTIGIVNEVDEKGNAKSFKCVRVGERSKGHLDLALTDPDQREMAAYILLHPKLTDGQFKDSNKVQVISIIDKNKYANEQRAIRSAKKIATDYAQAMSQKQVAEFADAMSWDSTEDEGVLRNMIEDLAENTPDMFNDLVKDEKMKFQAIVKQAFDNKIISYDPTSNKISWTSTTQPIAQLSNELDKNEVEKAALWFQLGGDKAGKIFEKIKSLIDSPAKVK